MQFQTRGAAQWYIYGCLYDTPVGGHFRPRFFRAGQRHRTALAGFPKIPDRIQQDRHLDCRRFPLSIIPVITPSPAPRFWSFHQEEIRSMPIASMSDRPGNTTGLFECRFHAKVPAHRIFRRQYAHSGRLPISPLPYVSPNPATDRILSAHCIPNRGLVSGLKRIRPRLGEAPAIQTPVNSPRYDVLCPIVRRRVAHVLLRQNHRRLNDMPPPHLNGAFVASLQ